MVGSCSCYQTQFQTQDCSLTNFFNVSAMWMLVQTRSIWGIVVGLSSFILMQEVNVIADYVRLNLESKSL